MPFYKIYFGLGGGYGGARYDSTEEFDNEEEAEEYAYERACETFESYNGLYGLQTVEEIMKEEGVDEEYAEEMWNEQRDNWVDYRVKLATGPDDTDD
jgi:hypothetical protein